jgi:hypothetical protein
MMLFVVCKLCLLLFRTGELEDNKGVWTDNTIDKMTINNLQNTKQKTKDRAMRTSLKIRKVMMLFVVCKLCLLLFSNLFKQSHTVPVPRQRNKHTL